MSERTALLIEPDANSANFTRHMLSRAGFQPLYAPSGKEGLIIAWRDQPEVIIIELELPDIDGLEVIQKLRADPRTEKVPIIGLSQRGTPNAMRAGLDAGLNEYIIKQTDAIDILLQTLAKTGVLSSFDSEERGRTRGGGSIVFLGAKGGVGTSSIGINIADSIGRETPDQSLVIDSCRPLGSLAAYCGAGDAINDLTQLAAWPRERLRAEEFRSNLERPEGWAFRLVPGYSNPERGSNLDIDNLASLLQALQGTFQTIFVDIGTDLSPASLFFLSKADLIVLLIAPAPHVLSAARNVLAYLDSEDIKLDLIMPLSNRPIGIEDMSLEEVSQQLGLKIDSNIPHMGPNLHLSTNQNRPLQDRFKGELGTQMLEEAVVRIKERISEKEGNLA